MSLNVISRRGTLHVSFRAMDGSMHAGIACVVGQGIYCGICGDTALDGGKMYDIVGFYMKYYVKSCDFFLRDALEISCSLLSRIF